MCHFVKIVPARNNAVDTTETGLNLKLSFRKVTSIVPTLFETTSQDTEAGQFQFPLGFVTLRRDNGQIMFGYHVGGSNALELHWYYRKRIFLILKLKSKSEF